MYKIKRFSQAVEQKEFTGAVKLANKAKKNNYFKTLPEKDLRSWAMSPTLESDKVHFGRMINRRFQYPKDNINKIINNKSNV